jgi:hypothetical protein
MLIPIKDFQDYSGLSNVEMSPSSTLRS